jgi:hypothetical protein
MTNLAPALNQTNPPHPDLDRVFERLLDFFDELEGLDAKDNPEVLDRTLANLWVLKRRIAAALWLSGDRRRALLLGFPEDAETQQVVLELCAGDTPRNFIATYAIDGKACQEERMALCLFQAELEFHHHLAQKLGRPLPEISVRPAEEREGE